MADVVVTVPKWFGLEEWIAEGDAVGEPWTGEEWHFYTGGSIPTIDPGERVYIVFNVSIRGYAPLVRVETHFYSPGRLAFVRHGGAVAVTIPRPYQGFRGWRYRDWAREEEIPFPDWRDPNAKPWEKSLATY